MRKKIRDKSIIDLSRNLSQLYYCGNRAITGIGPFRGFLQERLATGAKGENWFLFGEQRSICGDASRMAKDVDDALKSIVQQHGDMSAKQAETCVIKKSQSKRYGKDVY